PSKSPIAGLLADADGTVWVASTGSGLGRLRNGRLKWLDAKHGLPANHISCVLDDDLGNLWLGSNSGIIRISRAEPKAAADGMASRVHGGLFDVADGMPHGECSERTQPSGVKDSQGRLWFATQKGVAFINPQAEREHIRPPAVWIEAVDLVEPGG